MANGAIQSILEISQIYEKPTVEYAREHLHVAGMPEDEFLGIFWHVYFRVRDF